MIVCNVWEYIRPSGKKEAHTFNLDDKYQEAYDAMTEAGYHFTAEMLDISCNICACISNSERDADMKLCKESNLRESYGDMLEYRGWEKFPTEEDGHD